MNDRRFEEAIELPTIKKGNKSPLLMIHGIISSSDFFAEISDFLADDFETILYDRRGYGRSECQGITDYTVSSQAADAAKIIFENNNGPAWIFGNSAGGLIAIELALRYPELVRGMILLEPSLVLDEESKKLIAEWNHELNSYLEEERIKKVLPAFSRVVGNTEENSAPVSLEKMKQTYRNLANFMYGELNEVQNYRPEKSMVERIQVPVVIYVSEKGWDTIFGKTSLTSAKALDWRVEIVPGHHNTVRENPKELAEHIKKTMIEMEIIWREAQNMII